MTKQSSDTVVQKMTQQTCLTQPVFLFKYFSSVTEITTTPVCYNQQVHSRLFNATEWNNTIEMSPPFAIVQHPVINNPLKGYMLLFGGSVLYSVLIILQKQRLHDINAYVIIFWMCLTGTVLSATVMLATEIPTFPKSATCIMLLLGHSLSAAAGSIIGIAIIPLISPVTYSLLSSLQLVCFVVAQYTVLSEVNPGHGNWAEITGAILVICGSVTEPASSIVQQWTNDKKETEQRKCEE